jgi:hypothetical protein
VARNPGFSGQLGQENHQKNKTIRYALEGWESDIGNCQDTSQALCPNVKSLIKRDGPKARTVIHGPLGLKYRPLEKATPIADYLENQLTTHDLYDENHKRRVKAKVEATCDTPLERVRPCGIQN